MWIHLLAVPLAAIRYGHVEFLRNTLPTLGGDRKLYPPDYGYTLFGSCGSSSAAIWWLRHL